MWQLTEILFNLTFSQTQRPIITIYHTVCLLQICIFTTSIFRQEFFSSYFSQNNHYLIFCYTFCFLRNFSERAWAEVTLSGKVSWIWNKDQKNEATVTSYEILWKQLLLFREVRGYLFPWQFYKILTTVLLQIPWCNLHVKDCFITNCNILYRMNDKSWQRYVTTTSGHPFCREPIYSIVPNFYSTSK